MKKLPLSLLGFAGLSAGMFLAASCAAPSVNPSVQATESVAPVAHTPVYAAPVAVFEMRVLDRDKQVRVVEKPTLAALDFAAYFSNPIRLAGMDEKPENYTGKMANAKLAEFPFPMLDSLSEDEPDAVAGVAPIAWEPFAKILYAQTGDETLSKTLNEIEAVKWDEPDVFRAFQTVSRLWGVPGTGENQGKIEWWAEVMPAAWTGRAPFYGKLKVVSGGESAEVLNYYMTAEMNSEEAMNWARTLSSYWYPTLNTDLEQHTPGAIWENSSANRPFAVMRGNPMGKPMWVAFEVPAFRLTDEQLRAAAVADSLAAAGEVVPVNRTLDTSSYARLETLASMENSCPATPATKKFREALKKKLAKLPKEQNAWADNGMLWFRRNANYLVADKISGQDSLHNPLPRMIELKQYLDSMNVQLLVVPVPVKEEIYADKLVKGTPADLCVNVNGREFIREMLAAMEQLASRVTQYSWYADANPQPGSLVMKDTVVLREGDLVAHLPDKEKSKYAADTLAGMKIYKGDKSYKGGKNAPILLMGDSFTGVFESVDQKSGGPGSLLAYATGLDVQVLTSWGGGPGVRARLKKMKKDMLSKRLVIYMMTARDYWQSPMEWDGL